MAMPSMLRIFFPNNDKFYTLFEGVSLNVVKMSALFVTYVSENDFEARKALLRELEETEHANDDLTHNLFVTLGKNFITPFDREDIHYLASTLDDIIDYIWNSAMRMNDYNILPVDDAIVDFANRVARIAEILEKAIHQLRDVRNLMQIAENCILIGQMSHECDDMMDNATVQMFATATDASEVIRKLDVYEMLQIVAEKCQDVSNVVESILIKYS
ncbi:DUF47 domain-containing protein [Taibaiella soli]|uniref:DUF47 domain-containing protein n=1 Tax=Taibaiella soli TaxID=1649169 RepID=A0A2W2A7Z8_9BACT|nr:DUF47 family protein [Taibaiella soli]PZF71475.1 DUF47 domain-containing protein [Taibaiella soli]